ncbi:hypothetical protein [Streptomyces sp. Ag109_O5-10]|uniref:hypothetical protein n=1 Tax=Streptomyces sp. Ag109_O5-10 TaxID=1855349 RepID=UPI000895F4A7|nr:hypothetical protein [Streptomyces sp. Ag109_O5-10]SEE74857.1 hypothetical protein SAMN05216533_3525 [Streptomyces sp. Ag109_O5-10]
MGKITDRMRRQADENRQAAEWARDRGNEQRARQLEDRADELESGNVTDVTDQLSALTRWAFRR